MNYGISIHLALSETAMTEKLLNHPLKNFLMAIGMILFLALSFKLGGDLTSDEAVLSQTDTVISTLNQPAQVSVPTPTTPE